MNSCNIIKCWKIYQLTFQSIHVFSMLYTVTQILILITHTCTHSNTNSHTIHNTQGHTHRHTQYTQTHRHTDTQMHRQTDTHTHIKCLNIDVSFITLIFNL